MNVSCIPDENTNGNSNGNASSGITRNRPNSLSKDRSNATFFSPPLTSTPVSGHTDNQNGEIPLKNNKTPLDNIEALKYLLQFDPPKALLQFLFIIERDMCLVVNMAARGTAQVAHKENVIMSLGRERN